MNTKIKKILFPACLVLMFIIIQNCKNSQLITTTPPKSCDTTNLTYKDFYPAWSPNGNKIVFFHRDEIPTRCGIYTVDTNGTNFDLIKADCNARNSDWSHDGILIVYESTNSLYLISGSEPITGNYSAYYPSWSYDNQWIAFDSNDSLHYYAIWKIRPDGTGKKFIGEVNAGINCRMPDWSPDGTKLCYQKPASPTEMEIYTMDTLGNPGFRVTHNDRFDYLPKFSPDGTQILYQSQTTTGCINIWIINADGTGDTKLTDFQSEHPAWSPDGQMIVYINVEPNNGHMYIMKRDGSEKRQLTF
jgi:Tol biopolymer transport system component